jgi:5'(3')-deoxyribonucleotidase
MIDKIFVDMDGVVCDFTGAALKLHGIEYDPWADRDNLGQYSMEKLIEISIGDFWKKIDENTCQFWRDMEKTKEADKLIKYLESKISPENIYFLSSPAMDPSCYKGKVEWIRKHYPKYQRRLILTPYKYLLATPNRILIDDADKNIDLWETHKGKAVTVPRAWNSAYFHRHNTFYTVVEKIAKIIEDTSV